MGDSLLLGFSTSQQKPIIFEDESVSAVQFQGVQSAVKGACHLAPVFAPDLFVIKVREAMAHVGQR
jgi:hypothetical protein